MRCTGLVIRNIPEERLHVIGCDREYEWMLDRNDLLTKCG